MSVSRWTNFSKQITMRWLHTIISLAILSLSVMAKGQDSLSVAERNAAQGFNDTIDRLARTEKLNPS